MFVVSVQTTKSSEPAEGQSMQLWVHTNESPKWERKEPWCSSEQRQRKHQLPAVRPRHKDQLPLSPCISGGNKRRRKMFARERKLWAWPEWMRWPGGEQRAQRILIIVLFWMQVENLCDFCTIDRSRQGANIWTERKVQYVPRTA